MYKSLDIAKHVISRCTINKHPISNLHLQKILYCMQKDYLDRETDGLFEDEIQAWKFGPAVEEVYYFFCSNGAGLINKTYPVIINGEDLQEINMLIDYYSSFSIYELVNMVHQPDKAWAKTFKNGKGIGDIIPKELIKNNG